MSSRTPTECVDLATDESADEGQREEAIDELKMANECDELANLARADDLDERYRRRALQSLATSQCDSTLEGLVEEGALDGSVQEEAENLLRETEEGA